MRHSHTTQHSTTLVCAAWGHGSLADTGLILLPSDLANCRYRIQVVESNWPYFVGFGAPITLLMLLPQYYVVR